MDVRDLENEVLCAWDGRHAAQLLERDDQRHARLLERLGPWSLSDSGDPVTAMSIAGQLAAHLAVRPPPDLPRMADVAPQIARTINDTTPGDFRSLTTRDVRAAAATYRELGSDQPETLLHGDPPGQQHPAIPHQWLGGDRPLGTVGEIFALEALTVLRDRWTALPVSASPRAALLRQGTPSPTQLVSHQAA